MIKVNLCKQKKSKVDENSLGFGRYFTDHIFKMDYNPAEGWHNARIEPYSRFALDPSAMMFHYGQSIFEGLKAFRNNAGEIALFRPRDNFARMNRSADRMAIPRFDEEVAYSGLLKLLEIEKDWVPKTDGTSLYIRPTIIALDENLGVCASSTYLFYIILSPVAAYYASGFAPVSLYVEEFYSRSALGGTGEAKCSGNYAASIIAGEKAHKLGFDQVLWLDSKEKKYVEEVGSMNIFFMFGNEAVTPSLDGTILPGITRDSIIKILKSQGFKVTERRITIDEVINSASNGTLTEVFGTGTAAVVSPVASLNYQGKNCIIGDGSCGWVTARLYVTLTDIQKGRVADEFDWTVKL